MGECKAKTIQINLGTFRHSQTYPRIIQAYSGIFRTLCYLDIFYNCGISRTLTYSEPKAYSERWHIQKLRHIQNPVVHLRWSVIITRLQLFSQIIQQLFSQSLLRWNKYLEVVSPEVVMLCKKLWCARGPETVNFWYTNWYIQIN